MENKTKTQIENAKKGLADLLAGKDKETIDKIAGISKTLDEAIKESEKLSADYDEMKTDYIEIVKNTKFNASNEDDIAQEQEAGTLENIAREIIKKGNK